MRRNPYQRPLTEIELLPAPSLRVIGGVGGMNRAMLNLIIGWWATQARGAGKRLKGAARTFVMAGRVPAVNPESVDVEPPDVELVFLAAASPEAVEHDISVLGGAMHWKEDEAVIQTEWNRRRTALDMAGLMLPVYYELLATTAHEIGHAIDENVKNATGASYSSQKGQKWVHRYRDDDDEARARVWGATLAYTHAFLWMLTFATEYAERVPAADASAEEWVQAMFNSPLGGRGTDWMTDENFDILALMIRDHVQVCLPQTESFGGPPLPAGMNGLLQAIGAKRDSDNHEQQVVDYCQSL